jgi:hypothetical protein
MKHLLLFTLFFNQLAFGATETKITGTYAPGIQTSKNLILNPDCVGNTNNIASSAGTLTTSTSTPLVTGAGSQCSWAPGAGSATLKFSMASLPTNLASGNCIANFYTKANTAGHYAAYLEYDSVQVTTNLALDTTVDGQKFSITYPCGSATTRKLVITSLTTPSTLLIGGVSFGEVNSPIIPMGAEQVGTIKWAGTASCLWSITGTSWASFAADTDCPAPSVTGNVSAPSTKIPGLVIANAKPGKYLFLARGEFYGSAATEVRYRFSDGTNASGGVTFYGSAATIVSGGNITGDITLATQTANWTVQLQGEQNASGGTNLAYIDDQATNNSLELAVYYFPSSSTTILDQSATPWYVDAYLAGGNPDLGIVAVSSYTELIDGSMTLTPLAGSAAAGVMCSTTNAATAPSTGATTCAAGSESTGINFTIPRAGAYKACYYGSHLIQVDATETIGSMFQINETPTNAQTITTNGLTKVESGATGSGTDMGVIHPLAICSIFNWTSVGTKGLRLMYQQSVTGTPDSSVLLMATSGNQDRVGRWTVEPVTAAGPQPLYTQSVTARDNSLGVTTINTIVSKSANYTATDQDETIVFTADATLSLPAAASYKGKKYHIFASGATTEVTIDPNGSETVCGNTTVRMEGTETGTIQSDGTNWIGVAGFCDKEMSAYLTNTGSCAVSTQSGTWITSVSDPGVGKCGMVWSSATWAAAPRCQTTSATGGVFTVPLNPTTTTGLTTLSTSPSGGGTSTDAGFYIYCRGAR